MNQETPALDIPAIDYVIQGDREYCRLQQELNEANERNDGHAIARIHGQLETLDAWTIQSLSLIHIFSLLQISPYQLDRACLIQPILLHRGF